MKTILQNFQSKLSRVMEYQNDQVIIKYSQLHNIPFQAANEHFKDLKKFLLLCAVSDEPQSPAYMLDEIWHTFILFTRDYAKFCDEYLGTFVHHTPEVTTDNSRDRQSPKNYIKTRNFANQYFGEISENLWPDPTTALVSEICRSASGDCGNGGNCDGSGSGKIYNKA